MEPRKIGQHRRCFQSIHIPQRTLRQLLHPQTLLGRAQRREELLGAKGQRDPLLYLTQQIEVVQQPVRPLGTGHAGLQPFLHPPSHGLQHVQRDLALGHRLPARPLPIHHPALRFLSP